MEPIYLHDWNVNNPAKLYDSGGLVGLIMDFDDVRYSTPGEVAAAAASPKWQGVEILLASYCYENYSGDAFVLFRKDGQLFEVNASHCSCYGLEGQWEPEETSVVALRHRLDKGTLGNDDWSGNIFADELRAVLDQLEAPPV